MVWENIVKPPRQGGQIYGAKWNEFPCMSLTGNGITINQMAMEVFGLKLGNYVHLCFDSERRCLGLKKVVDGEDLYGAAKISKSSGATKKSCQIGIPKGYRDRWKDCRGRAFRAHLNSTDRIIEISLQPDNML